MKTVAFGRYCLPEEPLDRERIEEILFTRDNSLKRIVMSIDQVLLN
jgi:hypothetical protein